MGIIIAVVIVLLVLLFILSMFVTWVIIANSSYSYNRLFPGKAYVLGGRTYTFPNTSITGPPFMLTDRYFTALRGLLKQTTELMNSLNIDYWITGGTLLGSVRNTSLPMPFDDDVDIAVRFSQRDFLFSSEFKDKARAHGLRVLQVIATDTKRANAIGSCIRLQFNDVHANHQTLDIFFWQTEGDVVYKLDGWAGKSLVRNPNETFETKHVFPIQKNIQIDGMIVNMPRMPEKLLKKQYGDDVLTKTYIRPRLLGHLFVFKLFGWVFY